MTTIDPATHIAEAVRLLEAAGVIDYNGHASLRVSGGFQINSGASNRAAIGAGDIVRADETGRARAGEAAAPREAALHVAIYRARPDAGAVVHAHPPWSTQLTTSSVPYEPVFAQGALLGAVPVFPDSRSISHAVIARDMAAALGERRALLLRSHGAVTVGATLEEATVLMLYLEENARRQILGRMLGGYRVLDEEERQDAEGLRDAKLFEKAWAYHAARSRAARS